jgi:hypothetical protein
MEKNELIAEQDPHTDGVADNRAVSAFHGQWNLIK